MYNEIKLQRYSLKYLKFSQPFVSSPPTWVFCRRLQIPNPYSLLCTLLFLDLYSNTYESPFMSSVLSNLSSTRLIYCSIIASPEQRMIFSATVSKMDHWPRTASVGRAVRYKKVEATEHLRRAISQPEGNVIIIPLS